MKELERKPIDIKRERGGTSEIGSDEDGAILEMYNLDGRTVVIKEKSLYEFFLADTIDPNRTNINLPGSIQKLIINEGSESELVSATFLTAKTLFQSQYFKGIDTGKAVKLSLDLLIELNALQKEVNDYLAKEKEVSEAYEDRRNKNYSFAVPAIGNAETRCTTIFQKADRSEQILIEIIMLFHAADGIKIQSHFADFHVALKNKYGESDPFYTFIGKTLDFMNIVRELRNCLDHRLPFVKVTDFELRPDSSILSPTIELNFRKTKLERHSLSSFLTVLLPNFIMISELTFAQLAVKNSTPFILPVVVKEIPEETRRFKFMKFAFWSNFGGSGWYHQ